jgi:hypothetical protein
MDTNSTEPLSKEDTAFLIRSFWEALLGPNWLRNDLIELGKLVFAKVRLKDVEPELFQRLLPHLNTIANSLGPKMLKLRTQYGAAAAPAASPATAAPKSTPPAPSPAPPAPPAPSPAPPTPSPTPPAPSPTPPAPSPALLPPAPPADLLDPPTPDKADDHGQ